MSEDDINMHLCCINNILYFAGQRQAGANVLDGARHLHNHAKGTRNPSDVGLYSLHIIWIYRGVMQQGGWHAANPLSIEWPGILQNCSGISRVWKSIIYHLLYAPTILDLLHTIATPPGSIYWHTCFSRWKTKKHKANHLRIINATSWPRPTKHYNTKLQTRYSEQRTPWGQLQNSWAQKNPNHKGLRSLMRWRGSRGLHSWAARCTYVCQLSLASSHFDSFSQTPGENKSLWASKSAAVQQNDQGQPRIALYH